MITMLKNKLSTIQQEIAVFPKNIQQIYNEMKNLGPKGLLKIFWTDLFANRTFSQWLYLISLSFIIPISIEYWVNGTIVDPISLFTSITGIICVILVAEGRASNYLFGLITNTIYLILSIKTAFYGEVATMIFFIVMQPIGLYTWIVNASNHKKQNNDKTETHIEVKRFNFKTWAIYSVGMLLVWFGMGKAYESIGSAHAYRDSITDATNFAGQAAQTQLAPEQWIFWILTNIFSIYLWFGDGFDVNAVTPANLSIMVMYFVYTINSIVGWVKWNQMVKK